MKTFSEKKLTGRTVFLRKKRRGGDFFGQKENTLPGTRSGKFCPLPEAICLREHIENSANPAISLANDNVILLLFGTLFSPPLKFDHVNMYRLGE